MKGFVMDPSCKVYLPLYRMQPMGGILIDESPYHNQFTVSGATRNEFRYCTTEKEFVLNGEFVNTDNWTAVGLDSFAIVNGRVRITDATPPGYITQTVSGLEVGKLYLFKVGLSRLPPDYPTVFAELRQNGNPLISRTHDGSGYRSVCNHFISVATTAEIRLGISSTAGSGQYGGLACCSLREITHFESAKGFWFDDIDDLIAGPQLSTLGMENQFTWIVWATRQSSFRENETPFFANFPRGSVYFDRSIILALYLTSTPSGFIDYYLSGQLSYNGEPYMYAFVHDSSIGQWARAYNKGNVIAGGLNPRAEPMDFSTANIRLGSAVWTASSGTIIHELAMFNRAMSIPELDNYYHITRRRYE